MDDRGRAMMVLALAIEIVSGGEWKANQASTEDQVRLYFAGVRDGRIADVTFQAVCLVGMIPT